MKYRYITNGTCTPYTPLANCKLLRKLPASTIQTYRIQADDLILERYLDYDLTADKRRVGDMSCTVCIRIRNKLTSMPQLNGIPVHLLSKELQKMGYYPTTTVGYLPKLEYIDYLTAIEQKGD